MRQERWWAGLAAVGLLVTGLAWLGRPEPYRLGTATTGDPALAATVRAAIDDPSGHRGLAVALVADGTVRYAGLGDPGGPEGSRVDQDTAATCAARWAGPVRGAGHRLVAVQCARRERRLG
jgi:hypothetical protein